MIQRFLVTVIFFAFAATHLFFAPPARAKEPEGPQYSSVQSPYPVIIDIVFLGNRVTRPDTMLQEMKLRKGDRSDPEKIAASRQAIMDLNLFKSVVIEEKSVEGGALLEVTVEEKFFILPLPTLGYSNDGDISYGAYIKWYNMFGLNYTFKLKGKAKNFADGDMDKKKFIAFEYTMPRLNSGPWELYLYGDYSRNRIYAHDEDRSGFKQSTWLGGFSLMRWRHLDGPSSGWFTRGGVSITGKKHELDIGTPSLYEDGLEPHLTLGVGFKAVHNHLFSRTGKEFGYTFGLGHSPVDCEGLFTTHYLYYRSYHWLFDNPHHNLNFQLQGAFASDTLYQEHSFKLGSGSTLRGYERDSVAGNAYLLANIEYLHPLLGNPPIRGVIFADLGNSWENIDDVDLSDLKGCVGFGVRAKVKYFVKLDLVLEWAFAANGENKVYAGTSLPF
ncbi:MAG: BamA/TamA family outer membrane protein [Desulfocapsa sp.]|nr:BamA/TamA family outer membrane protein [Desulfocapsa sp.]